jgi:hypothetical protein
MTPRQWLRAIRAPEKLVICETNQGDWPILAVGILLFLRDALKAVASGLGGRLGRRAPARRPDQT